MDILRPEFGVCRPKNGVFNKWSPYEIGKNDVLIRQISGYNAKIGVKTPNLGLKFLNI